MYFFERERKFSSVVGYNKYCRDKFLLAKRLLMKWIQGGKIRSGCVFENMKRARKDFVNALKYCKKHKQKIADDILAEKFKLGRCKDFWNEVKKRRTNYNSVINEIDGVTDSSSIANLFHEKFKFISGADDSNNSFNNNFNLDLILLNFSLPIMFVNVLIT